MIFLWLGIIMNGLTEFEVNLFQWQYLRWLVFWVILYHPGCLLNFIIVTRMFGLKPNSRFTECAEGYKIFAPITTIQGKDFRTYGFIACSVFSFPFLGLLKLLACLASLLRLLFRILHPLVHFRPSPKIL